MTYKIKITTTQTDYKGKSIFDRAADELLIDETFSLNDEEGTIETTLYGELESVQNKYVLSYEEETEGMGGVFTEIKFEKGKPNEVAIVRTGAIDTYMFFEKGKRHVCVYNTGIMPFEICIYSKEVDNKLLSEGYLEIAYLIEIKGACAQKTVMRMELERV